MTLMHLFGSYGSENHLKLKFRKNSETYVRGLVKINVDVPTVNGSKFVVESNIPLNSVFKSLRDKLK